MINIIVELSKYVILTLMLLYTFHCLFLVHLEGHPEKKKHMEGHLRSQSFLIFFLLFVAFLDLYLQADTQVILTAYLEMMVLFLLAQFLYRKLYPRCSRLLLNNTCMLLGIGFTVLCRLDPDLAHRQILIAAGSLLLSLIVPVMIRKWRFLKKLTWLYAGTGIAMLGAVFVLARSSYGAKLSLMGIQPSEAIKLTFVFFMASLLWRKVTLRKVLAAALVGALHVGILVLSRDLGTALIFFVTFLVMLYASTRSKLYLDLGIASGMGASVAGYYLFGHVRERVSAWLHPMEVYQNEGYQIVQSLFAIGTGGWFGMGLYRGFPENIPVVQNDFIFSAIAEELGGIFAICLIVICMCLFMMILDIAMGIKSPFYKLIALGLGTEYAFQVFLTIGGAIKLIPMTGVTLPLISYGGSSLVCTMLMLAIVQGLTIYREDEDEEIERLRREAAHRRSFLSKWEQSKVPARSPWNSRS